MAKQLIRSRYSRMKTVRYFKTSAIAVSLLSLLAAGTAYADVTTNQQAKPDDWNKAFKLQPLNAKQKKQGASVFDKSNQLRCWQHGDLIVLENGFKPVDGNKGKLLSKGSNSLHAFDYGETFCVYLGG